MNALLVIAEDFALRESLRAALGDDNLLLFERSIEDALRRLISVHADMVIIDDAPGIAPGAVRRLRESAPHLPVLVLANRTDSGTVAHYILEGAKECIGKPFQCDELAEAIERSIHAGDRALVPEVLRPLPVASAPASLGQYQTALRWMNRTTSLIRDPGRLAESIVESMLDTFGAVRCAVLLDRDGGVHIAASHGIQNTIREDLRFGYMSGLMRWFEENRVMFDRLGNRDASGAVKEMHLLGARLGVPIVAEGHVCGALLIGEKGSGLEYAAEERELLTALGRCASIAIENAQLYSANMRQRQRLDAVLGNIAAGFVLVGPNKTVTMMNPAAESVLQLRAVDVVGRSVQKLGSAFADIVLRTLAEGKPRLRQEIQDPAIDSRLGLSATPLENEGVAIVFSKIPEQTVDAEDVAYSPFWEYLASRVAQEIKNPMVAVNTFAQLLPRKYDSPDFREAFGDVVQKEVARINHVVETLFEFARHPRLALDKTNLTWTVRSVVNSFEMELAARSIELSMDFPDPSIEAKLDPEHFAQALRNVVQNSIEAMPKGGKLHVATRTKGDACEVVVSDTGPGISEKDASLIFLPFFSTKEQGMGLGLTLAERIMKQHNGDIRLVGNTEAGSAFSLSVPVEAEADANHTGR
jgi:signal transduction histidine kinase/CheY-like chemotaxis protein